MVEIKQRNMDASAIINMQGLNQLEKMNSHGQSVGKLLNSGKQLSKTNLNSSTSNQNMMQDRVSKGIGNQESLYKLNNATDSAHSSTVAAFKVQGTQAYEATPSG